jgi:hypothetical protein
MLLCACSDTGAEDLDSGENRTQNAAFVFTRQDIATDAGEAQEINLSDCGELFTITEGGDYLLYGSMEGNVLIDTYEDELVHLYLSNAEIASQHGPAISAVSASKLIVTLVSDTENILSDSPDYADYQETKSCLYSAADLTINGDGTMFVYGYYEDGIRSKDRIKIVGGLLDVQAKGDGIRGNDGIVINGGEVKVQSEGCGLRTTNRGTDSRGVVELSGGNVNITAGRNGIAAASDLYISDCVCSAYSIEETFQSEGTKYIDEECVQ